MKEYTGQIRCKKFITKLGYNKQYKWRLSPYRYTTFNKPYLIRTAALDAGITQEQMAAALRAYQNQFDQLMLNGHSIELEGLGNFRLSMSFKTAEGVEDISMDLFKRLRVLFRPSVDLRDEMKGVKHIVDDPQMVFSQGYGFIADRQFPIRQPTSVAWHLTLFADSEKLMPTNLDDVSDLFFVLGDGDILTYDAHQSQGTTAIFEGTAGRNLEFEWTQVSGKWDLTSTSGLHKGDSIKMVGGVAKPTGY